MPDFLHHAAMQLAQKTCRRTLLTIAHEEKSHAHLFKEACLFIHLRPRKTKLKHLEELWYFVSVNDSHAILGLCFGLEIIANENIEYLFQKLGAQSKLNLTSFFMIHRVNEQAHIEMNYKNYKLFCHTPKEIQSFHFGFYYGLSFWQKFWDQALC